MSSLASSASCWASWSVLSPSSSYVEYPSSLHQLHSSPTGWSHWSRPAAPGSHTAHQCVTQVAMCARLLGGHVHKCAAHLLAHVEEWHAWAERQWLVPSPAPRAARAQQPRWAKWHQLQRRPCCNPCFLNANLTVWELCGRPIWKVLETWPIWRTIRLAVTGFSSCVFLSLGPAAGALGGCFGLCRTQKCLQKVLISDWLMIEPLVWPMVYK